MLSRGERHVDGVPEQRRSVSKRGRGGPYTTGLTSITFQGYDPIATAAEEVESHYGRV